MRNLEPREEQGSTPGRTKPPPAITHALRISSWPPRTRHDSSKPPYLSSYCSLCLDALPAWKTSPVDPLRSNSNTIPPSPRNPPLLSPGRSPSSLLLVGQLFPGLSPRPLLHVHPPALQGGKGTINAATIVDFNLPWEEMPGRDSGACTSTAPPPQL